MELSRKAILSKTHYGINIYAYILRQYYSGNEFDEVESRTQNKDNLSCPQTVLSLSGRDCKPAKNPFNENKHSLKVSIVDNCAIHSDTGGTIPDGDVFDFAELHFKKEGNDLLEAINNELHLHIGENRSFYKNRRNENSKDSIEKTSEVKTAPKVKVRIPEFSYFRGPVSNTIPDRTISLNDLFSLIKGSDFEKTTNTLRSIQEVKEARKFKAFNFNYVTISGTFSKRNDKALLTHSGLLVIDFDHIPNLTELKELLLQDEYFETELLFISPSGDGLKWIIPIDLTLAKHQDYFRAVANYIKYTYQLEVDQSGKDVSRACFIPHDKAVYINPKYIL